METMEAAIATAYKKDYGKKGQKIKAKFNPVTGEAKFWQLKLVVDESILYTEQEIEEMKAKKIAFQDDFAAHKEGEEAPKKVVFNPEKHIMLQESQKMNPKIKVGEELEIPLVSKQDYGRIAAQTAKQVILQKIREAEKQIIAAEYRSKEGEIISGVVQRMEGQTVFVDIGRTLGVLDRDEKVQGEFYRPGQRMKFYILKVEDAPRGSVVVLSRAYPKFVSKLFELEVPEITSGIVSVKSIAREPGYRTKIAVASSEERIDPIGSVVGQRGARIAAVISELNGEKIDAIQWEEDPKRYIESALSPAKVLKVKIGDKNTAEVLVSGDQLSLAIGKDGRNVRLASNLTGWKIDIKSANNENVAEIAKEMKEDRKDEEAENPLSPEATEGQGGATQKTEGEEDAENETAQNTEGGEKSEKKTEEKGTKDTENKENEEETTKEE